MKKKIFLVLAAALAVSIGSMVQGTPAVSLSDSMEAEENMDCTYAAITSVTADNTGVIFYWEDDADLYLVLQYDGSKWAELSETEDNSYTDTAAAPGDLTYAVLCHEDGNTEWEEPGKEDAYTFTLLPSPSLTSATQRGNAIVLSWKKVSGASKYRVYRNTGSGWKAYAETGSTTYTDTSASAGYSYTVQCLDSKGNPVSGYDTTGISCKDYKALTAPSVSTPQTASGGISLSWGSVSEASGYGIFRKGSGEWELITVTSKTSYTDTASLSNNTSYTYEIRAYIGTASDAKSAGYADSIWGPGSTASTKYFATPKLTSAANAATGVTVSWGKVSGASGYMVYRKTSGGSWKAAGTTTSTSYTDTSAASGTKYYYTVRAYSGSSSSSKYAAQYWSHYDSSGVSCTYLKTTAVTSFTAASNGTKLAWSNVSGASGYAIYRKKEGGSYSCIGTSSSTTYTDTSSRENGVKYYYIIRAYKGSWSTAKNNPSTLMAPSGSASSVKYYKTPALKSTSASADGTKITWSSTGSNLKYTVYRKKAGGSWSRIGDTTGTSFTDKTSLSSGSTYYYTVRASSQYYSMTSGKFDANYCSGYDATGIKVVYLGIPSMNQPSVSSSKVTVSWGKVSGASGYAVYRKTYGGSWKMIATTTSTKYVDKSSKSSGKAYIYTVRAYKGSLKTAKAHTYSAAYWSGYNSTGKAVAWGNIVINSGASKSNVTSYNNALNKLPAWMKGMYLAQGRKITAVSKTSLGKLDKTYTIAGQYNGNITLANVKDNKDWASNVIHEMGHWADATIYKKTKTYASRTSEFSSIYKSEYSKFSKLIKSNVSGKYYPYSSYSSTDDKKGEMFANAFALYYTNPSKLKKNCPKTYAYIQKEIKVLSKY